MDNGKLEQAINKGVFYIPNYQRDYAWRKEQFDELWEDLKENVEMNKQAESKDAKSDRKASGHFLGTIVIAPHGEPRSRAYDLIDGQQRMTTIFMLLYVLLQRSERRSSSLVEDDRTGKLRLQVIDKNQEYFTKLLSCARTNHVGEEIKSQAQTQGQKNLCEVFDKILAAVSGLDDPNDQDKKEINLYIDTLRDMQLIVFEEDDAGQAIRTFQSVNDRGVPLKTFDKLKSLFIYYSNRYCENKKLDNEVNNLFGEIFAYSAEIEAHKHGSVVGGNNFKEADMLRFHLGSYPAVDFRTGPRTTTEQSYEMIKKYLASLKLDPIALAEFIELYTIDLRNFFKALVEILDRIDSSKVLFECLYLENLNTRLYPTLIRLYMEPHDARTDRDELVGIITRADFLLSKLFRSEIVYDINRQIRDSGDKLTKEQLIAAIKAICLKTNKNPESSIAHFVDSAYNTDSKSGYHYAFIKENCPDLGIGSLLELVKTKQGNYDLGNALTIEHIFSQDWGENGEWAAYGFDDEYDLRNLKNAYGNLMSFERSLNSGAGNGDPIIQKRPRYGESHIPYVKEFSYKVEKFNKQAILTRNENARKFLKDFFKDFIS